MTGSQSGIRRVELLEGRRMVLSGELGVDVIPQVRAQGEAMLEKVEAGETLTLDLSGVATTSSAVLSLLLAWQRFAGAAGFELALVGAPSRLFDMARVSGLDALLPFREGPA